MIWEMRVSIWEMTVSIWGILSLCLEGEGVALDAAHAVTLMLEAGVYTRPLFGLTRAVSDTKKYPQHPLIAPKHSHGG